MVRGYGDPVIPCIVTVAAKFLILITACGADVITIWKKMYQQASETSSRLPSLAREPIFNDAWNLINFFFNLVEKYNALKAIIVFTDYKNESS